MAMHIAAIDLELPLPRIDDVAPNRLDVALLEWMDRHRLGKRLGVLREVPRGIVRLASGLAQAGRIDLRVLRHGSREGAVVGHPSRQQLLAHKRHGGTLLNRALAMRQWHRMRPFCAIEACQERLPHHARPAAVRPLAGPVPEEHRQRPAAIERQLRILEVGEQAVDIERLEFRLGLHPRTARALHDLDRALLVQRHCQRRGDQVPLVLAPIRTRFVPRQPWRAIWSDRHVRMRLEARTAGDLFDIAQLPAGVRAVEHVVVAAVVSVPYDMRLAIRSASHLGLPVIGGRLADLQRLSPSSVPHAHPYIRLPTACRTLRALPHHGNLAIASRRSPVERIRASGADLLRIPTVRAVQQPAPNVPSCAFPLAPKHP